MSPSIQTPRGTVTVSEAQPSDAAPFRELRLEALQDSPTAFSADYQRNLSYSLKYWEDLLTAHPDESTMCLAKFENQMIGMTGIARGGSPKTSHAATVWGVYVTPGWRGLHIAEEMIRACLAWARARNVVIAKLGVAAVNTPAIRCYERSGFEIYATEPRALFHEGNYYDFHMMACSLHNE
jgi:ribosomal protein S18 acetylase RimI-like enzyme